MPKSRDELCRQAIDNLMSSTYDIQYQIINSQTARKSFVHYYDIEIPKLIKLYDVDTNHTINGITYGPGPMFIEQDLPTAQEFIEHFNQYFEEYAFYEQPTSSGPPLRTSFIETTHLADDGDKLVASVIVKYIKKYYPFQIQTTVADVETKYNELLSQYDKKHSQCLLLINDNKHYRRRLKNVSHELYTVRNNMQSVRPKFTSLQNIIKTLYGKNAMTDDCPVCYESMPVEKLVVPDCGHFICSSCSPLCTRCPICRDEGMNHYTDVSFT